MKSFFIDKYIFLSRILIPKSRETWKWLKLIPRHNIVEIIHEI